MRTPKRYFSYPSDPNADMSDLYEQEPKQHARWKRKNREAQLKRTIAKYKKIGKGWQQECMKARAEYKLWRGRAYAADLSFAAV